MARRIVRNRGPIPVRALLQQHFGRTHFEALSVAERTFPYRVRADLQQAIRDILHSRANVQFFGGVLKEYAYEGIDFPGLLSDNDRPAVVAPPQYEAVDVGNDRPVDCLKNGLWLLRSGKLPYAVLVAPRSRRGDTTAMAFQIATPASAAGQKLAEDVFRDLEQAAMQARSYRGKILSLEAEDRYSGQATGIRVHKLKTVQREQVILPARTLELLERNVIGFVRNRSALSKFGQSTKKGILFYGPPGTGKTHTIHYLAGSLPGHTTLLISAEQVAWLSDYMTLARLLQPSLVIIEDVDLIARDRTTMDSPCEEALLNKLLNEMDGLKEDADILFVLTTNRPEMLETALASRPGRVDQAIEFPLPDLEGRHKLVRLYSQGMKAKDKVIEAIVRRTDGVSAAFIKELMRRSMQFHLEQTGQLTSEIALADVDAALNEMLFAGGSLNRKILGGNWAGTGTTLG